jgi:glutamate 5-kinase
VETDRKNLAGASSIVVKLGTQLLSSPDGKLDGAYLEDIAQQVAALRSRKIRLTLVSSGAIACGVSELG